MICLGLTKRLMIEIMLTTQLFPPVCLKTVINRLEHVYLLALEWFECNHMKLNSLNPIPTGGGG